MHNKFLDTITDRILLDSPKLLHNLNQMFRQVLTFAEAVREFPGLALVTDVHARVTVERIQADF